MDKTLKFQESRVVIDGKLQAGKVIPALFYDKINTYLVTGAGCHIRNLYGQRSYSNGDRSEGRINVLKTNINTTEYILAVNNNGYWLIGDLQPCLLTVTAGSLEAKVKNYYFLCAAAQGDCGYVGIGTRSCRPATHRDNTRCIVYGNIAGVKTGGSHERIDIGDIEGGDKGRVKLDRKRHFGNVGEVYNPHRHTEIITCIG